MIQTDLSDPEMGRLVDPFREHEDLALKMIANMG